MNLETKITETLARHESDVQTSPRGWIEVERRIARSHKRRLVAAGIVSAAVAAAAIVTPIQITSNKPQGYVAPVGSSTPSPSPSVSPEPTPTPTPTPSSTPPPPLEIPASWHRFSSSELGISFSAPFIPGRDFEDPRFDEPPALDRGIGYWWGPAHGVSKDYLAGRGDSVADNIGWSKEGSSYVVQQCDSCRDPFTVTALRVVERPDGLRAIIFDAEDYYRKYWPEFKPIHYPVAVLDYPKDFDPDLIAINFFFSEEDYPDFTLDDVETVILSVAFSSAGPRR